MEETLWEMEDAKMQVKRVAIDGTWLSIMCFEEDGGVRIEVEQEVSGKRHKVFPDNKINFKESSDENS